MARETGSTAAIGAFPRRHPFWFTVAALAILGTGGWLWWRARGHQAKYVTATVTRGSIQRSVSTTGALNPVVTVQVGSYVSGTVKSLGCDFNTEVVIGQVCATIDPVPFQLIVDQDQAEVGTAQAQLKKDQAALVYAKIAYARDSKLLAEGTVSQDTVDNDKSVLDQTVAAIGLDDATIANKVATLKAAQVNLAYTNIVSPVIGTVITRSIDVGQTVAASLQSPTLFLIGKDLTHMQVDTNVSEADVGGVRVGEAANFSVQAYPTMTFRGKVTQIRRGPITVQNVVTYDVVVAVDNPNRILFPGMTADAHIVTDEHDDVLRVPLPAVRFNPEGLGRPHGGGAGRGGEGRGGEGGQGAQGGAGGAGGDESAAAGGATGSAAPPEGATGVAGSATGGTAPGGTAGGAAAGGAEGGAGGPGSTGGGPGGGHHRHREPGAEGTRSAGAEGGPGGEQGGPRRGDEGQGGAGSWGGPGQHHGEGGPGQHHGEGGPGQHHGEAGPGRHHGEGGPAGAGPGGPGAATTEGATSREGRAGGAGAGDHRPGRPGGGQHHSRVWVLQADGSLKAVPVVTGLDDGALIEVSGPGLHAGDKVVVNEIVPNEARRNGPHAPGQRPGGGFGQGGPPGGAPVRL